MAYWSHPPSAALDYLDEHWREHCEQERISAAVRHEREACARIADGVVDPVPSELTAVSSETAKFIARLIRMRT